MDINQNTQATAPQGPVKFDQAEIAELSGIRQAYDEITLGFGQLELQKREVKKTENRLNERLTSVEAQEKVFLDKIVAKYGEGSFDVTTGLFTPRKSQ